VPADGASSWTPAGVAVDENGFVYVTTANSNINPPPASFDHSESVIRLSAYPMVEQSFFAPSDWAFLNALDGDIGSVGPVLLNNGLLFVIGKGPTGYLVPASNLPGIGNELYSANVCGNGAFGATAWSSPYLYVSCQSSGVARLTINTLSPSFTVDW